MNKVFCVLLELDRTSFARSSSADALAVASLVAESSNRPKLEPVPSLASQPRRMSTSVGYGRIGLSRFQFSGQQTPKPALILCAYRIINSDGSGLAFLIMLSFCLD